MVAVVVVVVVLVVILLFLFLLLIFLAVFLAWARPKDCKFRFVLSNFPVILVILSMFSFQFPRQKTIPALLGHPGCCPRAARVAADHIPLWPPWKYGQFPEVLEKPSRLSGLTTASRVPFSETCTNIFQVLKKMGKKRPLMSVTGNLYPSQKW